MHIFSVCDWFTVQLETRTSTTPTHHSGFQIIKQPDQTSSFWSSTFHLGSPNLVDLSSAGDHFLRQWLVLGQNWALAIFASIDSFFHPHICNQRMLESHPAFGRCRALRSTIEGHKRSPPLLLIPIQSDFYALARYVHGWRSGCKII